MQCKSSRPSRRVALASCVVASCCVNVADTCHLVETCKFEHNHARTGERAPSSLHCLSSSLTPPDQLSHSDSLSVFNRCTFSALQQHSYYLSSFPRAAAVAGKGFIEWEQVPSRDVESHVGLRLLEAQMVYLSSLAGRSMSCYLVNRCSSSFITSYIRWDVPSIAERCV